MRETKGETKKVFKQIFSMLMVITLIVSMNAITGQAKKRAVKLRKVVLNHSSFQLQKGKKLKLKASLKPKNATQRKLKWKSSKKGVATVSQKGVVKALKTGTAKITVSVRGTNKKATCKIRVIEPTAGDSISPSPTPGMPTDKPTDTPTDKPADTPTDKPTDTPTDKPTDTPTGTIYRQQYDVTRWYNAESASQSVTGHSHDGYRSSNYAIWTIGFYDNPYSTDEDEYMTDGIDLSRVNNAEYADTGNPHDFRGEELRVKGEFSYEGTDMEKVLFRINYTSPASYPVLWKWEKGASALDSLPGAELNKVKSNITDNGYGKYGAEEVKHGETGKLDISFTIPEDAVNEDMVDEKGDNYGIYLCFPNRPDGALIYRKDNTFHFRNFTITY